MLLKNQMEDKKLNLNQPFLSVRKKTGNSVPVLHPRPPTYKSELKSGPVRNPGSVPFQWENAPGQPKEETKLQPLDFNDNDKLPSSPRLPPFLYPKAVNNEENVKRVEELGTSVSSGNSDEVYVDALDTLSRSESAFLNSSMSGLSGDNSFETKPSRNFDPLTREFMMDRFLPAAKEVAREQTQVKKIVRRDKPVLRYGPSFAKQYSHYQTNEEESEDEYDEHRNFGAVCGLLPRFCLNPIPSMSVRTRVPMSPDISYSKTKNEVERNQTAEEKTIKASLRNELSLLEEKVILVNSDETKLKGNNVIELDVKGFKTFQELLDDKEILDELVFEKTVYVDTVKNVESPKLSSCSPKEDKNRDLKKFAAVNGETKFGGPNTVSLVHISNKKRGMEMRKAFKENQDQFHLVSTKTGSLRKKSEFPAPPPLPKSPSDSWLFRTLPSISTKNLPRHSTNHHDQKDSKWEAIVKSTNMMHYSEDTLTAIPEA